MTKQSSSESDETPVRSRRALLATAGTGAAASLAGCGFLSSRKSGSGPPGPGSGGSDVPGPDERLPMVMAIERNDGLSLTESTVTVSIGEATTLVDADDPARLTIRVYTEPLFIGERSKIGEITREQSELIGNYTIPLSFAEEQFGYAQQLHYTVAIDGPVKRPERPLPPGRRDGGRHPVKDAEANPKEWRRWLREDDQLISGETVIVPFYNRALDEEMLSVEGPPEPTDDLWDDGLTSIADSTLWFDEPDESPFEAPEVPEELYPREWYGDYRDLLVTVLVRYPVYEVMSEEDQDRPRFDWAVFNLDLSAWEMLESRRWNDYTIQQVERGTYERAETAAESSTLLNGASRIVFGGDAADAPRPFERYYASRYGEAAPALSGRQMATMNPITFAGGRSFSKRWAETMQASLDANPNFATHDAPDYYRATILKALVGGTIPYKFDSGGAHHAPERVVSLWAKAANGEDVSGAADCKGATTLFCGIAVHLLDAPVAVLHMDGENIPSHMLAAAIDLEEPSYLPQDHPNAQAGSRIRESDRFCTDLDGNQIDCEYNRKYQSGFGDFVSIECLHPNPIIGYATYNSQGSYYLRLPTFAGDIDVNTHVPLDEDFEPAADGEIPAPREPPQNAFKFRRTVVDPSPKPWFELLQE